MTPETAPDTTHPSPESEGRFALLFSGGLDTTLEVVERMKTHREAHLLTFNNGYCINTKGGVRRAGEMKDRFGDDRIFDLLINTKPLMQTILHDFKALWKEYRSPLIIDMGCKMAAVTELILYAKKNNIEEISDGAAVEQTQIFLQHPEFSAHVKPLISAYGLRFLKPLLFDMGREDKIAMLNALDFDGAGAKYWPWWERHYPECERWPVQKEKDPGEAFKSGVNIREWVKAGLPRGLK